MPKVLKAYMFWEKFGQLGPVQTSNFTCAESNANERKQFFSFALDSAHVKFDVWTGP